MAYHVEKGTGDIVIDGFEAGIADSPEQGIAFMRNVNLVSIPGEAAVNYATTAINVPPVGITGVSCTLDTATHSVTWTATATLYTDCAVTFSTSVGGVTAGTVYWISNVSGNTFKIYADIAHQTQILVTDATTTFTVISFGQPTYRTLDEVNGYIFILDLNGRAWWVNASGNLTFLGNTTLTSTHGNGIAANNGFLYVWRDQAIDYYVIDFTTNAAPNWVYGWQSTGLAVNAASNYTHSALIAQDAGIYFCNNKFVGSIKQAAAGTPIDPSVTSSYVYNASALQLPFTDSVTCLAELGYTLLVGGILNKVYPWDRVNINYEYPLILGENYTTRMVTTNTTTYIFAGYRGRIYQTNGSNVNLFKKIPDHITLDFGGGTDPYFTWLDAMYWKNQIYFSFNVAKNDGTALNTMGGIWAFDVSMNIMGTPTSVAFRLTNILSAGAAAHAYVLAPNIRTSTPAGAGIYAGWVNPLTSAYGVDVTTSSPYTTAGIGAEIYCDLIPTGLFLTPKQFAQVEFKLSAPLVANEKVEIYARQNYADAWSNLIGSTTTVGAVSDVYTVNFEGGNSSTNSNGQWIQLYAALFSTATTPSFTRLKELRIR